MMKKKVMKTTNNKHRKTILRASVLLGISACIAPAFAQDATTVQRNAYFGDLHLHTANSFDAFLGGSFIYPEGAYRFARGEEIDYGGRKVKMRAPLDFLAVTDHSEYLAALPIAADPKGPFAKSRWPQFFADAKSNNTMAAVLHFHDGFAGKKVYEPELLEETFKKSNWQRQIAAAENAYTPGKFTTFVGYEWSSMPGEANLHRNVIFRGPNYPDVPFSALDSTRPEDLWRYLDNNRDKGIDTVAIPHNSNVSDGLMFDYLDSDKNPISKEYAETRARNERLVEITQAKGNSETRPELSPNDEFANFELINNLLTVPQVSKIDGGYVRQAYARGLTIQQRVGVNPFQYGVIGASDIHSGLAETSETEWPGSASGVVDNAKRILANTEGLGGALISSSGLTGVWANANTREDIFAALKRREAFGTSGTRLQVRLFAGNYPEAITKKADWLEQVYRNGVPMGTAISAAGTKAPRFIVQAVKDPDSANLDRIQIVKVWLEKDKQREQVFDVVWAGKRQRDAKSGRVPAIGSTVDLARATYTNTIGAPELIGEWSDPQFDAQRPAIYYARVLEIPTPRWTTQLAVKVGEPLPKGIAPTLQERGWTSPIFFNPKPQTAYAGKP